jgi:SAM-dependent methyltransferase
VAGRIDSAEIGLLEPISDTSHGLEIDSARFCCMSVHDTARHGFAKAADVYEDSRPSYPAAAIEWLTAELRLGPGSTVVDLAAGTGKLTRLLIPTGAAVIAIEPVDQMREALRSTTPDADARQGTAEQTGLPDASADAVTVAQAFHWFDAPKALAEIHRILGPTGRIALVWNIRDLDDPIQHAIDDLFTPYRGDTPSHRSGHWRDALDASDLFATTETNHFPNVQTLDAETLVRRVASTSFIADLPNRDRSAVLDQARAIADGLPDRFAFPYTTEIEVLIRTP